MALLPYLFGEMRPRRVQDQLLGLDLADDLLADVFDRPTIQVRRYLRPWRNLAAMARDVGSTIKTDKDKFEVNLDVQHFDPEEISVKTSEGYVVVEGKHEERQDEHGYVSRHFRRRYALPEGCSPEAVESRLSSDGVLTVSAPRRPAVAGERAIPVARTGPVRRKLQDHDSGIADNGIVDGEAEVQEKTPQKKRRR